MELEFCVNGETLACETLRVVGNIDELGSWQVDKSIEMIKNDDNKHWSARVNLASNCDTKIEYRYFCCQYLYKSKTDPRIIVTRWETHFTPRIYAKVQNGSKSVDSFGTVGHHYKVDRGWLTCQSEIRLSLHGKNSLLFWDSSSVKFARNILVTPIDLDQQNNSTETGSIDEQKRHGDCELSVLSYPNCTYNGVQSRFGRRFEADDYFSYKIQTLAPKFLGFRFDFFNDPHSSSSGDDGNVQRIGFCYLLPVTDGDTLGQKTIPILALDNRPIGTITMNYFIIHPSPLNMDMSQSFVRYWKKRKPLDVGHRGMGVSYKKTAMVRENTIGSLNSAANFGADYVEFDVQLSKDLIPVLFHDFHLNMAVQKREKDSEDFILHEISVNELNLSDLKKLKLYHEKCPTTHDAKCLNESNDNDQEPFPTLNEVFNSVDPHLGFNVEIKYPMCTNDGVWESEKRLERNLYVDKILTEVFHHVAEDRRIVFSSFEPYICSMLRLKQNKYPVMFLTQGETKRYPPYTEILTGSSEIAVAFALSNEFLGVCFHSEPLLREPNAFHSASKFGLVSFVWGDDLSSAENIQYFKNLGFDGIIFDRINDYVTGKRNVFRVEKETLQSNIL